MKTGIFKARIVPIVAVILLVVFVLPNFALAQTTVSENVITNADLQKAQTSIQECMNFRNKIWNVTNQSFKAVISMLVDITKPFDSTKTSCFIVSASFGDRKITSTRTTEGYFFVGNTALQPPGSQELQSLIKNGKGINSAQATASHMKDLEDQEKAGPISSIIGWLLNSVLSVVNLFLAQLTAIAGKIYMTSVDWVTKGTIPVMVEVGWGIVRDFANMLFILILIVIAIAAILRIEAYDYRHLLGELVLMAILVNFSKVIAVTLIRFVDLISIMFAPHSFAELYSMVWNTIWGDLGSLPNGWMSGLFQGLSKLIFSLVALASFLALAGLMVVRLVGLYVLIIFSPMAYVLDILPATKHFAHEWWQYFAKYLVWVPISFFMVRLTILLSNTLDAKDSTFNYIILMAFMWGAVIVAEHAGMVGGNAVVKGAEKLAHELGHGMAGLAGRSYTKWVSKKQEAAEGQGKAGASRFWRAAQFVNPHVAKEAWEERTKEKEEEAYLPAVGMTHDSLNRVMPTEWHGWGSLKGVLKGHKPHMTMGPQTYYGRIGQRQLFAHKKKIIEEAGLGEEDKVKATNGATHAEDHIAWASSLQSGRNEDGQEILTALAEREAYAKKLEGRYFGQYKEEFLRAGATTDEAEVKARDAAWAKANAQAVEEVPAEFDMQDYQDHLTDKLQAAGLNSEQIGDRMSLLSEQAEAEQKQRGLGMEVYEHDGKYRASNDLTGYAKMEKDLGSAQMLKAIKDLNVQGMGVEEEDIKDAAGNTIPDGKGGTMKKVVKLTFDGKDITNYSTLQGAIEATKGTNAKDRANRRIRRADLRYEIVGARKDDSANKRMMRGDSERWARSFEPAAYMVQDDKGDFTRFTAYGRRRFANISSATVKSFRKTRGVQARVLKMAGVYQNDDGKTDVAKFRFDVMAQAFEQNADMASAILGKGTYTETDLNTITTELQTALRSIGSTKTYTVTQLKEIMKDPK